MIKNVLKKTIRIIKSYLKSLKHIKKLLNSYYKLLVLVVVLVLVLVLVLVRVLVLVLVLVQAVIYSS